MNFIFKLSLSLSFLLAGFAPRVEADCKAMAYIDKPGNYDPLFSECSDANVRPVLAAMAACVEKELVPPANRMLRHQGERELVTCADCLSWERLYNNKLYCESIGMGYCGRRERKLKEIVSADTEERQLQSTTLPDGMVEYTKTNTCRMIVNTVGAEARCGYNHAKVVYSNLCTIAG